MTELSPVLAELERMYGVIYDAYFHKDRHSDQVLVAPTPPMITLASKGKKRTQMGWYTPSVWSDQQDDLLEVLSGNVPGTPGYVEPTKRAEITIATEVLKDPVQTVVELARQTLIHVRLERHRIGGMGWGPPHLVGKDGYYPILWKHEAHTIDCTARENPEQYSRGWSKLVPNPGFIINVADKVNTQLFDVTRKDEAQKAPVGSRMKKWSCGCTTIRCATEVYATCESCYNVFVWAEKEEAPSWKGYRRTGGKALYASTLKKGSR